MKHLLLNFHGVGETRKNLDPGEFAYWLPAARFAEIIAAAAQQPRERIGITFDDSNESDITTCAPILERHGFRACFFVLLGRIGKPGSLGAQDIRALHRAGHEIGSHGIAHLDWTRLDPGQLREEVEDSRLALSEIIGAEVKKAGIPFGRYNRCVLRALRRAGYERVYTSDGGLARKGRWLQPRISLRRDHGMDEIRALLDFRSSHYSCPLRGTKRRVKRWIKASL